LFSLLYFAFAHGKTINNLLYTNNLVNNQLSNIQNLYNFFDFGNVASGRRITAIRAGFGKKEGTHIYIGYLYGYGMQSYSLENTTEKEYNHVVELDAKLKISDQHQLSFQYGRSLLQLSGVSQTDENSFNPSFISSDRSNAALVNWQSSLVKIRTKISLTSRLIDPFYKSYGIGFIRSDNFRVEAKLDQSLGKKIKISALYRRDEDNLLRLLSYKNTLQTVGLNLSYRHSKALSLRVGLHPVLQEVHNLSDETYFNNENLIANAVITWNKTGKKFRTGVNIIGSYYSLSDGINSTVFENITLSQNIQSKKISNQISASYFFSSGSDSLYSGSTILISEELSFSVSQKVSFTGAIRYADGSIYGTQVGGSLKAAVQYNDHFRWEISGERIILGDFYNSYNYLQVKEFPFYCLTRLIITW
jgi:hypothetical protein